VSVVKHFIEDSIKKTEIDEFLRKEFERAGYGGVSITKTPLGTHLVIYTMRPGLVIGRGGETIRALSTVLEENFELPSPQISVAEIEVPELNAYVVASRIASAMKRGIHYRRAGFWGLTQAMQAGAMGIEIVISGKLRTDRARYEKFREGYLPKSGEPPRKYTRKAELHVKLKPGILGVKVRLIPPESVFPDQVKVHLVDETVEAPVSDSTVPVAEEKIESDEQADKTEGPLAEDKAVTEAKEISPMKKIVVAEKKVEEVKVLAADLKVVPEKKVVKTEAQPVAMKPQAEKKIEQKVAKKPVPDKAKTVSEAKPVPTLEKKVLTEKKVVKAKTPTKPKVVVDQKVTKTKAMAFAKKAVAEKIVAKKVAKKQSVAAAKEKVAPKKKTAKPAVTPAKEKKAAKKKVSKTKAPSAEKKKEAGK